MTTYSIPEIAWFVAQKFTGSNIEFATAIAWRESRGVADVMGDKDNPQPGCNSWGMFQINVCPQGNNRGTPWRENPRMLLDPVNAVNAAFEMSKGGTDWGPWMTYRPGIVPPDVAMVAAEIKKAGGPQRPTGATTPDPTYGITGEPEPEHDNELLGRITDPARWKRLGLATAGMVFSLVGLYVLIPAVTRKSVLPSVLGKKKTAKKAAPTAPKKAPIQHDPTGKLPGESAAQHAARLANLKETP